MFNISLISISIVCFLVIATDLFLFKKAMLKRGRVGKVMFLVIGIIALLGSYIAINGMIQSKSKDIANTYLAYQYLNNTQLDFAEEKIKLLDDRDLDVQIMQLLTKGLEGEYTATFMEADTLSHNRKARKRQKECLNTIQSISALGAQIELQSEDALKPNEALIANTSDSKERKALIDRLYYGEVLKNVESLRVPEKIKEKYDAIYQVELAIKEKSQNERTENAIKDLMAQYPNDTDVLKTTIQYKMIHHDLEAAKEYSKKLIQEESSLENKLIYTDIVAQQVRRSWENRDMSLGGSASFSTSEDGEIRGLYKEFKKCKDRAEQITQKLLTVANPAQIEKLTIEREKLFNQAIEIEKNANTIEIRRAINYLLASEPLFGDRTGLVRLQISKLYLALDEKDKAKNELEKLLKREFTVSSDSPIAEPLSEVIDVYNQTVGAVTDSMIEPAVNRLVEKMGQGMIPLEEQSIQQEFSNFVTSDIKYGRTQLHISRIDTTSFPQVKASMNISEEKKGAWIFSKDYQSKDFGVIDTEYEIEDIVLAENSEAESANIAIVIDTSGSMQGRPLEDAKLAAIACAEKMGTGQSISFSTYSDHARLLRGLTDSADLLKGSIYPVSASGGTNIAGGLQCGIDSLNAAEGIKAVILLSDGKDNQSIQGALEKALSDAKSMNIAIYAVGMGEAEDDYMLKISNETGGKYIKASNTTELTDVYSVIQRYVVNNYALAYTVKGNPDRKDRKLMVSLTEHNAFDEKSYSLGTPDENQEEEANLEAGEGISKVAPSDLWLDSVTPSSICATDLSNVQMISLKGQNFSEGMRVLIGEKDARKVIVKDANTAEIQLPASLTAGDYPITVKLKDKRTLTKHNALMVYRPGKAKKVKVGNLTIEANTIGILNEQNFIASGNVLINEYLRFTGDLRITADTSQKIDLNSNNVIELSTRGTVFGKGKLYVSYSDIKKANGGGELFANVVMKGEDLIIKNGELSLNVTENGSYFELSSSSVLMSIGQLLKVKCDDLKITDDGLLYQVIGMDTEKIRKSVTDSIFNKNSKKDATSTSTSEFLSEKNNSTAKKEPTKKSVFDLSTKVSFLATNKDIVADIEAGFKRSDGLFSLGNWGINELSLQIKTNDPKKQYYKIGGKLDLSKVSPLGKDTFIEADIESYYLYPDSFHVMLGLGEGIPVFGKIDLTELGGGIEGIAKSIIEKDAKELAVILQAKFDVVLLRKLPKDSPLQALNKILTLNETYIKAQPFALALELNTQLDVFDTKVAGANVKLNPSLLESTVDLTLDLKALGVEAGGSGKLAVIVQKEYFNAAFQLKGYIRGYGYHQSGEVQVVFMGDDGIYSVESILNYDRLFKVSYNSNSDIVWFKKYSLEL